jgi:hypothetical protein
MSAAHYIVDFRDSSQIFRESTQEKGSIQESAKPFFGSAGIPSFVSKEEFQMWFRTGSRFPLAIKGHTFSLSRDGMVRVDGGKFVYEEALQLVAMLNSRSPFTQMNATLVIWERNGALRFIVIALLVVVAAAVFVIASR